MAFESYRLTDRQVMCGHFQSCDKDGGHTIQSSVVKNPMIHANVVTIFYRTGVMGDQVYIVGVGIVNVFGSCDLGLHLMTFIYEPDPYCMKINQMCKYKLCTSRLLKVIVATYIHTDKQTEIIKHTALLMLKNFNTIV